MLWEFPRIEHLPHSHAAADDLVLSHNEAAQFLSRPVLVFEKMDGINVAVGFHRSRGVVVQLKTMWRGVLNGAVESALCLYMMQREAALERLLGGGRVLYGEWLGHTLSVPYPQLDDFFHVFALRDAHGVLLPRGRLERAMQTVPLRLAQPTAQAVCGNLAGVRRHVRRSRWGHHRMEGVILESPSARGLRYAKWVEPSYEHVEPDELVLRFNGLRPKAGTRRRYHTPVRI